MGKKESKKRPRNDDGTGRDGRDGSKRHQVRLKDSEVFTRLQQFERQIDEVLRLTRTPLRTPSIRPPPIPVQQRFEKKG